MPLITSDPYLSIWSPYDKLNEGTTRHWTNDEKSLIGAVRVDGKVYRFMGKQALESLLPMAGSEELEGNYTFDAPQGEWTAVNYNAEGWKKERELSVQMTCLLYEQAGIRKIFGYVVSLI